MPDTGPYKRLADAERRKLEKKLRAWGRSKKNTRRLQLINLMGRRDLTEAEAAEYKALTQEWERIEGPLWDDRLAFMDEKMAKHGLKWNADRTEILRLDGSLLGPPADAPTAND